MPALITFSLFSSTALAQVQSRPLSETGLFNLSDVLMLTAVTLIPLKLFTAGGGNLRFPHLNPHAPRGATGRKPVALTGFGHASFVKQKIYILIGTIKYYFARSHWFNTGCFSRVRFEPPLFISFSKILFPAIITFSLFAIQSLAQTQPDPLSQLYPMDASILLFGLLALGSFIVKKSFMNAHGGNFGFKPSNPQAPGRCTQSSAGSVYLLPAHGLYPTIALNIAKAINKLTWKIKSVYLLKSPQALFISFSKILLSAIISLSLLSIPALAQVQSHPLSQVAPMDVNLNLTGVNVTNVTYVFWGNNTNDVNLYRPVADILGTDDILRLVTTGTSGALQFVDANLRLYRSSNDLIIDTIGNVGINTSTPRALLQVATVSSSSTDAVNITNLGSGDSFVVEDSAADTSPFIIDNAGQVGIGTTSPQSLLHVNSTTANVYIHFPVNNTAIASTDCDANSEVGRSILGWNVTSSYLYVCSIQGGSTIGWRVLQTLGA